MNTVLRTIRQLSTTIAGALSGRARVARRAALLGLAALILVGSNLATASRAAATSPRYAGTLLDGGFAYCENAGQSQGPHYALAFRAAAFAYNQHPGAHDWQWIRQRAWLRVWDPSASQWDWATKNGRYVVTPWVDLWSGDEDAIALPAGVGASLARDQLGTLYIPELNRYYQVVTEIAWVKSGTVTVGSASVTKPAGHIVFGDLFYYGVSYCDYTPQEFVITYP